MGRPGAAGAQNDLRYAVFPDTRRLVINDRGKITVYDTGDHRIFGVAQAQSSDQTLSFTSQDGLAPTCKKSPPAARSGPTAPGNENQIRGA
jgi:hypothetical protein